MGDVRQPGPGATSNERDALTLRSIPTMTLSTEKNHLTAVLRQDESATPSSRAAARFGVEGNAVITGGAGTLGLAVARALLEHGAASVTLLDLPATLESSSEQIEKLRASFKARAQKIRTIPVDVTSAQMVEDTISQAVSDVGGVDILCCLAGIVSCVASVSATQSQFQKVIDVNLTGSFLCAQAVAKYMISQTRGGSIVFTSSISAHHTNFPQPQVAYNVSKAAVLHMTRNLAAEWAVYGIRVNSISPGYMNTILNAGDNLKPIREIWAASCPMGRVGDVEEITAPFVLLNSKRGGRYITGVDIVVDGGAMAL
jgi:sorbose reductase